MTNKRSRSLDEPPQLPPQLSDDVCYRHKFIQWKKQFELYVKSKSLRLWRIIEFGDHVPKKVSPYDGRIDDKPEREWSKEDEEKVSENSFAIRLLYSVLPDEDFEIIYFCRTAHDIWINLDIIYEGKYEKESKINDLEEQFYAFKVRGVNNIFSKYLRFRSIINRLKALGKTYTNEKCVERFLDALNSSWKNKVKAIREKGNLSVLSFDELIKDLQVYHAEKFEVRFVYESDGYLDSD